MTIFKNFTEEMFKETIKKEKFSKKDYKIFITELVDNLPKEINLTPIKYENDLFNLNSILCYLLDGHKGNVAFGIDEHSSITWFVSTSTTLKELEDKLINDLKEECKLINLSRSLEFENNINKYKEEYEEMFNLIKVINKNKEITVIYDNKEKETYFKTPSRKKLNYHHLTYDLAKNFLNEKGKYDKTDFCKIRRILDMKNNVIFERKI